MRAINLIPAEQRGGASRTGAGPFVLLAALALLVVGVTTYVLTGNAITERRDELASLRAQAQRAQAQAEAHRPYREFAELAAARVETVRELGTARFDWQRALADFSKIVPENVWLTSLLGTVAPGVSVEGGSSGDAGGLRSAMTSPALELSGCTRTHEDVARLISRLRLMEGVERVALADSTKSEGDSDCAGGRAGFPEFDVVVFFEPVPTIEAPGAAGAATGAAPQPASTTPPPSSAGGTSSGGSSGGSPQ